MSVFHFVTIYFDFDYTASMLRLINGPVIIRRDDSVKYCWNGKINNLEDILILN